MTRSTRVFVAFACAAALLATTGTVALAAMVYRAGTVEIHVTDSDHGVAIKIPGIVFPVAAILVPSSTMRDAARRVSPYLPAARAAIDELVRCPDAVFVEVEDHGAHVRIGKKDGAFFVDVRSDGETVHLKIPLHALEPVLSRLESATRETV